GGPACGNRAGDGECAPDPDRDHLQDDVRDRLGRGEPGLAVPEPREERGQAERGRGHEEREVGDRERGEGRHAANVLAARANRNYRCSYTVDMPTNRERSLRAAVEILATGGIRALTHRRVDEQAGLPEGSTSN